MTTAQFNHGFIQASTGGMIVLNLSQKNWIIGEGTTLEEDQDWRVNTSTAEETMFLPSTWSPSSGRSWRN